MYTVYEIALSNNETYTLPIPINDKISAQDGGGFIAELLKSPAIVLNEIDHGTETARFVAIFPQSICRVTWISTSTIDRLREGTFWMPVPDAL